MTNDTDHTGLEQAARAAAHDDEMFSKAFSNGETTAEWIVKNSKTKETEDELQM